MRRTRKGAGKGRPSQDVKSVNQDVKALQKQARELLKRAGLNLREFRKDVSALKKAGVVSPRYIVKEHRPTRYMLSKRRRFADVLRGEMLAVPAPKDIRERYSKSGVLEQRGRFLIVPKEREADVARISRGMVEVNSPLKNGEWTRLILPFHPHDLEQLATRFLEDPSLDGMKRPDELFTYRLFKHTANQGFGFPTADALGEHIFGKSSIAWSLDGKKGREAIKHFELYKFKAKDSHFPAPDDEARVYTPRRKARTSGQRDHLREQRLKRNAAKAKKRRASETPEVREKRLQYQREYKAGMRGPKSER